MRRAWMAAAGLGLIGWWLLRPFRVEVAGRSMEPELVAGDYLVAMRTRSIRPGSLVVLEHPTRPGFDVVKRVTAMAGDTVGGAALAAGEVWVSGDNPAASSDSRSFGPVGMDAVKGVVRLRYWPPERIRVFG